MPNSTLTNEQRTLFERTTAIYSFTLEDAANPAVPIPAADLVTLTLTLYDTATNGIINSRDAQNILNANNVTVDSDGLVTFTMQPEDNAIIGAPAANTPEAHGMQFRWTWGSAPPYKAGEHFVIVQVTARDHVNNP